MLIQTKIVTCVLISKSLIFINLKIPERQTLQNLCRGSAYMISAVYVDSLNIRFS
jgi:hypothetical protein